GRPAARCAGGRKRGGPLMFENFTIPVGDWAETVLDWINDTFAWLLDLISLVVGFLVEGLADALAGLPAIVMVLVLAAVALFFRSWQLAAGTVVTMLVIVGMDLWQEAMYTLAMVLIATLIAVILAIPLGIAAARNDTFSAVQKPILDFM